MNRWILVILALALIGTLLALTTRRKSQSTSLDFAYRSFSTPDGQSLVSEGRLRLFREWCRTHNKTYGTFELAYRFFIWNDNYQFVQDVNSQNLSYRLEVNKFAALTSEEFSALYLGLNWSPDASKAVGLIFLKETGLPDSIDWREKGAVTEIKNQGECGSCYSFSTVASLEGASFLKSGKLVNFSEQQIVDCSFVHGNKGCVGGLITYALAYARDYGVELAHDYPYKAVDGPCKYNANKVVFHNYDYRNVPRNNLNQLKAAVAMQPVSVGIQGNEDAFRFYKSGILSSGCGNRWINHAVVIVGYATSSDQKDYWIVKNSWGTSWGMEGYIFIERGVQNSGAGLCGINSEASYPIN